MKNALVPLPSFDPDSWIGRALALTWIRRAEGDEPSWASCDAWDTLVWHGAIDMALRDGVRAAA